ncbi:hypothetical protein ACFC1R_06215 [Kitasatospora sp. NPDC056138]|uniref:RICIN domain-containing protein n=1 Tax=Kitasatospora sp. NPDC056138 TaxID=3345724 RepID=UPI0035DDACFC
MRISKVIRTVAVTAFTLAASMALTPTADASTWGGHIIQWQLNGVAGPLCLDSNSSGSVYAQGCNGGAYQSWSMSDQLGAYSVKDAATGRFLCFDPGNHSIRTGNCSNGAAAYYTWQVQYASQGGGYWLKNLAIGSCLAYEGNRLVMDSCHNDDLYDHFRWLANRRS